MLNPFRAMIAPNLRAAGRSLYAAQRRPAQKRLMSSAAASGEEPGSFYAVWVLPEVLPIVFCITAALAFSGWMIFKNGATHEDVTWMKPLKKKGVAANYADKYPGVESVCRSGAQKMEAHH
ncbi:hypothetical protein T484DRAFT_1974590 [Baffinella frigidus]|nr:hypothetical protein T484DRAFT_1974590 [Cryptophyta sp. CCMP2293]|mmetsp:Transcript_26148/g.62378  ORF Transcript_26148/g.62378 Transcript_26148/m.62378 type:complete len:121 (+) Transcript_26148:67-429(+)